MKAQLLTIIILFAGATAALAQETTDGEGPKIVVENSLYDFGDIEKGQKVTTVFKFKNEGKAPLEILNVATSCGCTSAKPEKSIYQPGENGEIPVTFNSERFAGPITKRVTIHTNDATSPKTVVTIKGKVTVEVEAKPASLFFAKAKMNEKVSQEIMVSTGKMEQLDVTDIQLSPDFLTATVERVDNKNVKIIVTADGSKFPKGKARLNGSLTYKTNSKTQPELKSIVTVNIERPIRVSPNSVYFFASKAGKKRESFIKMISTDDQAFQIKDIKKDLDFIEVQVKEDDEKNKALVITLLENAPEGKFTGAVTISTSLSSLPEVVVPIRGSVIK